MRSKQATAQLDHIFYALSDPTRREILTALSKGESSITELAQHSHLTFAAVAKHLRVLERGHLIKRRADKKDGRAKVLELRPREVEKAVDWLEKHRQFWKDRFTELESYVAENYSPEKGEKP